MEQNEEIPDALRPLRRWIFLMQQVHEAQYFVGRAEELGHPHLFVALEPILDFSVYFRSALNSYAKCFVSAGRGKIRLDAEKMFRDDPALLANHKRLMDLRHRYVAHSDDNEFEGSSLEVNDAPEALRVRLQYNWSFPFDRLYELRALIRLANEYVVDRHNECLAGLEKRIGKSLQIEHDD